MFYGHRWGKARIPAWGGQKTGAKPAQFVPEWNGSDGKLPGRGEIPGIDGRVFYFGGTGVGA